MRNSLILGSGRSGTSLLAGLLSKSGYQMGDNYIDPNPANPQGFWEDSEVNAINERLLADVVRARPRNRLGHFFPTRPGENQRWLAAVPLEARIRATPQLAERIQAKLKVKPYCYKDPRFCYTLPAWRAFLDNPIYLCVFREPSRTADSIVTQAKQSDHLRNLRVGYRRAMKIWILMYSHVLDLHRQHGEWMFLHYDQLLDGSATVRLQQRLGIDVDESFADPSLQRASTEGRIPPEAARRYRQLCSLARFHPEGTTGADALAQPPGRPP